MNLIICHNNERTVNDTIEKSKSLGFEVITVNKNSFYLSFKKALEIGKDLGWFVFMGGDQYLLPNAMATINSQIKKASKKTFRISGVGFDYLWNRTRLMTPAIYNGANIDLDLLEENKRPEAHLSRTMQISGCEVIINREMEIGNHDFDQYYRDIYKKGKGQASKGLVLEKLIKLETLDHRVFYKGIEDFYSNQETDIYKHFKITEKNAIHSNGRGGLHWFASLRGTR